MSLVPVFVFWGQHAKAPAFDLRPDPYIWQHYGKVRYIRAITVSISIGENLYKSCLYCNVADNSGINLPTSCVPLTGGVTGIGLAVPGATPGTTFGGVPDGSVVVVPDGTGVPGKPGKA